MAVRFIPVSEINTPLTISVGLSGGSGTGKTYSALRMARGIAEQITRKKGSPIGVVDTEGCRALHYKNAFPEMVHFDMQSHDAEGRRIGFPPERWIEVIDAAEEAGIVALVVDSFSHSWEGLDGVLELQAFELERLVQEAQKRAEKWGDNREIDPQRFSQLAWAAIKPRYRRLIDRIIRAKLHMIICTRAKPVMQAKGKNARATKTRMANVPWDPATDADLMFELSAMVILDPASKGCPVHQVKVADAFKSILDPRQPMTEETGRLMARWAMGDDEGNRQKRILDAARAVARRGGPAFAEWWNSEEGKSSRATVRPILGELQEIAAAADEDARAMDSDDPFATMGKPASDDGPTPEQMAAAEAAARAHAERERMDAGEG